MEFLGQLLGGCVCVLAVPFFLYFVLSGIGQERRAKAQDDYQTKVAELEAQIAARDKALDLSSVDRMGGHEFERYVAKLLINEGFFDVRVTQGSGDFGVDIVAKRADSKVAIQVKRHARNVSRHAISDAVAGMKHYNCTEAMVVTNSHFSKPAREFSLSVDCELIDRETLCEWIVRFQSS